MSNEGYIYLLWGGGAVRLPVYRKGPIVVITTQGEMITRESAWEALRNCDAERHGPVFFGIQDLRWYLVAVTMDLLIGETPMFKQLLEELPVGAVVDRIKNETLPF